VETTPQTYTPSFLELLLSPKGRVNRQSFWMIFITMFMFLVFVGGLGSAFLDKEFGQDGAISTSFFAVIWLLVSWPMFVVQMKRWHDRGKSGWWMLTGLIPLLGFVWFVVECGCLPGTPEPNKFGPPQGVDLYRKFNPPV
jgi:uncharacterized membrane protein YhaH (DUF805 family)